MEPTKRFDNKIIQFISSLESFSKALDFDLGNRSVEESDLIRNGQIQKFEYTLEIFWKTAKAFLYDIHGIDCGSPKACIKALFQNTGMSEDDYEKLIFMVNCRNSLSHIYDEDSINSIYNELSGFVGVFKRIEKHFIV